MDEELAADELGRPVAHPVRTRWVRLCTHPDNGAYRDVLPGKFGESVLLPEPFGIEIVTDGFPVYGAAPRTTRGSGG